MQLKRVQPQGPGFSRQRRGRGFSYRDEHGRPLTDPEQLQRIRSLAVPPAWRDVWISPLPEGHIQAVGTDDAGRRQYRYHDEWRRARDAEKHHRVLRLGHRMPQLRAEVAERLAEPRLTRRRVLAAAVRMLDIGVFRVGSEEYAPDEDGDEGSFGLATVRREHVRLKRGAVVFDYVAKGGVQRSLELRDAELRSVIGALLRRSGGGEELLAFWEGRRWHDVRSTDVNVAVKELAGDEFTAKDVRTWGATVLAAVALAAAAADGVPTSKRGRTRAINTALDEVAEHLGNTRAVARSSYVDPRLIEHFEEGRTVLRAVRRAGSADLADSGVRDAMERAVLRLLRS